MASSNRYFQKTLLEIVQEIPESQEFFRKLGEEIGICLLCEELFSTLEDIIQKYNLNKKTLENFLRNHIKNS